MPKSHVVEIVRHMVGHAPGRSTTISAALDDRGTTFGLCFEPLKPGQMQTKLTPPDEFMQDLADQLFAAGFTPRGLRLPQQGDSSDSFLAGKVEAMQAHMSDLRRMAFGEPKGPDQPLTAGGEY